MSDDLYNCSVSLIRRAKGRWMIDPEDVSAKIFYKELIGKKPGDCYLAEKTLGEFSYCILLSGGVCHPDVYGWIITLNGVRVLNLGTYLELSLKLWEQFVQLSEDEVEFRSLLHRLIRSRRLISRSFPAPIDRNVEYRYRLYPFSSEYRHNIECRERGRGIGKGFLLGGLASLFCVAGVILIFPFASRRTTSEVKRLDSMAVSAEQVTPVVLSVKEDSVYVAEADVCIPSRPSSSISKEADKALKRACDNSGSEPPRTPIEEGEGLDGDY